jgi:hypothetical protein
MKGVEPGSRMGQFEKYFGNVTDADRSPVSDATVDVVWLEPTTLEVTVAFPGDDVEVRNVRTELIGIIVDDEGTITAEYHDIAMWTDES